MLSLNREASFFQKRWQQVDSLHPQVRSIPKSQNMAAFHLEKIIPLIRISRKLMACDSRQRLAVLQQIPQIFESHQLISVLTDIIFSGICSRNFYKRIPAALYHEIEEALPEDMQLDLKDSLYESQLVEASEDIEGDEGSANQKKKRLPLTLLRIPSDLQCHLFQFLNFRDLMRVQRVCRSLCITARNPCSLYSLEINPELSTNHHFLNECYSRPKSLSIYDNLPTHRTYRPLIGNAKWSESVINLCIAHIDSKFDIRNLGIFVNLEKCRIISTQSILGNGQIRSNYTLRILHIKNVNLTEDVIEEIDKFKNLEVLILRNDYGAYRDSNLSRNSAPITLPRLREFSYSSCTSSRLFQRILIGSHPDVVNLKNDVKIEEIPPTDAAIDAIRAVKYLNVDLWNSVDVINSLSPLLRKAQRSGSPFFEDCKLSVGIDFDLDCNVSSTLQPIATLMECGKNSTFHLISDNMVSSDIIKYDIADFIKSSSFNTFNEMFMEMSVELYLEDVWSELDNIDIGELGYEVVRDVVMKDIDVAEKWMKSWLTFDKTNMKQIGMRKLDIKFKYEVSLNFEDLPDLVDWDDDDDAALRKKAKNLEGIMRKMTDLWFQHRVNCWSDIDSRCVSKIFELERSCNEQGLAYSVGLSLRA